jgi:hypothetical protein
MSSSSIKLKFIIPPCTAQSLVQLVDDVEAPVFAVNMSIACAATLSRLSVVEVNISSLTVKFALAPWFNALPELSDVVVTISSTLANVRSMSLENQALVFLCDLPYRLLASFNAEVQVQSTASAYSVSFRQSIDFVKSMKSSIVPSVVSHMGGDIKLILSGNELAFLRLSDDGLVVSLGSLRCGVSSAMQLEKIFTAIISVPKLSASDFSSPY